MDQFMIKMDVYSAFAFDWKNVYLLSVAFKKVNAKLSAAQSTLRSQQGALAECGKQQTDDKLCFLHCVAAVTILHWQNRPLQCTDKLFLAILRPYFSGGHISNRERNEEFENY